MTELRAYVAHETEGRPLPGHRVDPGTFERLRAMVTVHGWTAQMSEGEGTYRAWIRHTDGRRIWGRPADTAEAAAQLLINKVQPWAER